MVVWEGSSDLDLASLRRACRLGLLYPFLEGAVLHCGQRALRPCLPHLRPHTFPRCNTWHPAAPAGWTCCMPSTWQPSR